MPTIVRVLTTINKGWDAPSDVQRVVSSVLKQVLGKFGGKGGGKSNLAQAGGLKASTGAAGGFPRNPYGLGLVFTILDVRSALRCSAFRIRTTLISASLSSLSKVARSGVVLLICWLNSL